MNTHSRITGLLLLSALLLPNIAWCWGNNSDRYSHDYDRHERYENRESPQEYQYRKLGEYNQAKIDQQVETARQKTEYEQEKYRMQAEYQLQNLQK